MKWMSCSCPRFWAESDRGAHLLWQQCVGGCSREVVLILPGKLCLEVAEPLNAVPPI